MKVLLHVDVPKLGYLGDVVEVKAGFARNYLLPQGLAVEPTPANIKAIAEERARQAEVRRQARLELERLCKAVENAEVTIEALTNPQGHLFGSVSEVEIAEKLVAQGFAIKAKYVSLSENFRQIGTYDVTLKFAGDLSTAIKVHVVSKGAAPVEASQDDTADAEE